MDSRSLPVTPAPSWLPSPVMRQVRRCVGPAENRMEMLPLREGLSSPPPQPPAQAQGPSPDRTSPSPPHSSRYCWFSAPQINSSRLPWPWPRRGVTLRSRGWQTSFEGVEWACLGASCALKTKWTVARFFLSRNRCFLARVLSFHRAAGSAVAQPCPASPRHPRSIPGLKQKHRSGHRPKPGWFPPRSVFICSPREQPRVAACLAAAVTMHFLLASKLPGTQHACALSARRHCH